MKKKSKKVATPAETSNDGIIFEQHVQAVFVLYMLAGVPAPGMDWPISKIQLQNKNRRYATDDLLVVTKDPKGIREKKMLVQVKKSIRITEGNKVFQEVIADAWKDFNNSEIYAQGNDMIALITGPLSKTDTEHVRPIRDLAKRAGSAEDFFANVSGAKKQKKLAAFRSALARAQQVDDIAGDVLFEFMKAFCLVGYDFDTEASGDLSLVLSLIPTRRSENPEGVWGSLVLEVQKVSPRGGTITRDSISPGLREIFENQIRTLGLDATDPSQHEYVSALALANLFGAWDESNRADREAIERVTKEDYLTWIKKVRPALQHLDNFVVLENGHWRIKKRGVLWQVLGPWIHQEHIDGFKKCAVNVLSERDPQFELPTDERFAAIAHGKVLSHSPELRIGLAESLALFGNQSDALKHCLQQVKHIAGTAVREILHGADWALWGSLKHAIPILAEADPDEFLTAIEKAVQCSPSPFKKLFSEEGAGGVYGHNYLTEILWGLERIAWEPEYLLRVCVVLGQLAAQDPGGNWANRPKNSLWTILLPWRPQTTADDVQRRAVFKALKREVPEIAWSLALGLLPNRRQWMMETKKPIWRKTVPADWKRTVTSEDVDSYEQFHAEIVVDMAKGDMQKLETLVEKFSLLPTSSLEKILAHLSSDEITGKSDCERLPLWEKLENFSKLQKMAQHLDDATIKKVAAVADALSPKDPIYLRKRLFRQSEYELYDDRKNLEASREKLDLQRREVVQEILADGGINAVLKFAETIADAPWRVGFALATIDDPAHEANILPALLDADKDSLSAIALSYARKRYYRLGWKWVDGLNTENWTALQKALFLKEMPFARETWNRVANWIPSAEHEYWTRAIPLMEDEDAANFIFAIDKLHEYGQHHSAIDLLDQMRQKHGLDIARCVRSLLAAVSPDEMLDQMAGMRIESLIQALQEDEGADINDLMRVEWAYLSMLTGIGQLSARGLNKGLALSPEFFCKTISRICQPENAKGPKPELTEREHRVATNAYLLIDEWGTPPGTMLDGSFSQSDFTNWLSEAKERLAASGRTKVGLDYIGRVLFHCPADSKGLWIDEVVASALNEVDAEELRIGFYAAASSSRGARILDLSGNEDRELANQWREKAKLLENAGLQRFARTIRQVADFYDHHAEWAIGMAKERKERDDENA